MVADADPPRDHPLRDPPDLRAEFDLGAVHLHVDLESPKVDYFWTLEFGLWTFLCKISPYFVPSAQVSKLSIFADLWAFMRVRKKWWLLPLILLITLLGLILIFAQGSPLAPFIYTVF